MQFNAEKSSFTRLGLPSLSGSTNVLLSSNIASLRSCFSAGGNGTVWEAATSCAEAKRQKSAGFAGGVNLKIKLKIKSFEN